MTARKAPRISYTAAARADINAIVEWGINQGFGDPEAFGDALMDTIETTIGTLRGPGRQGRVEGTYELVLAASKHIAVYREDQGDFEVLRVLHGAQQFPTVAVRAAVAPHNFGAQTQQTKKGVRMRKKSK